MKLSILCGHFDKDGSKQVYLDAMMKSLERQTFQDYEFLLCSSGQYLPKINHIKDKTWTSHSLQQTEFPESIGRCFEEANPKSEFILLLNNDVILHKDCLATMIETMEGMPIEMILNPLCNSDAYGMFYFAHTGFTKDGQMFPFSFQHRYQEMEKYIDDIIGNQVIYPVLLIPMSFNPFYATLMRRSTYEKVGGIDRAYLTNKDDLDFAFRARKHNIKQMACLHAAAFHFGGVTTSEIKDPERNKFNLDLFEKKHGVRLT